MVVVLENNEKTSKISTLQIHNVLGSNLRYFEAFRISVAAWPGMAAYSMLGHATRVYYQDQPILQSRNLENSLHEKYKSDGHTERLPKNFALHCAMCIEAFAVTVMFICYLG